MRSARFFVFCVLTTIVASRHTYCVDGSSMEPTLRNGSFIMTIPAAVLSSTRGRVAVLTHPSDARRYVTKRIAAVAGDCVTPRGELIQGGRRVCSVIPPDRYFVLGDNPSFSTDSRHHGTVRSDAVAGIVIATLDFEHIRVVFP